MRPWGGALVGDEIGVCRPAERRRLLVLLESPKVRLASGLAGILDCCFEHECQSLSDRHQAPRGGTPVERDEGGGLMWK